MNLMENAETIDILVNTNEMKRLIVGLIIAKDLNYITLAYLNKEGEVHDKIINYPKETMINVDAGDFITYDGENFYKLKEMVLRNISNPEDAKEINIEGHQAIKEAAVNLMYIIRENNQLNR